MRHLNMVRLTVASLAVVALVGCTGLIDGGGNGGLTPEEAAARSAWQNRALPAFKATCSACHDGSRENIGFLLAGSDLAIRETILAYQPEVIDLDAPQSSRVLTKGLHEGPPLDAAATGDILDWIQKEKDAAGAADPTTNTLIQVEPFSFQLCTQGLPGDPTCPMNNIPLDSVGITGGRIQFIAQALGSGLYLTNLKLVPGDGGAFMRHPLFESIPATGDPIPDTIDRFFNVKMNLKMGATVEEQQIAGGAAAFVGFAAGPMDKMTILFKEAALYKPEDMPPPTGATGCKKLAEFETNAKPAFNANCASCHAGQNGNATSAMALTGIGGTGAALQTVCNQALTRINLTTLDQSGVFLAPAPGSNHPFKFPDATTLNNFKNQVLVWANAEKTAP